MAISLTNDTALASCNAIVDRVDQGAGPGKVKIYDGEPPVDADTALGVNNQLAELTMSDPAFGDAVDGQPGGRATANSITGDLSADATGTSTFFRVEDSNGTPIFQGSVTAQTGGGDMELDTISITAGEAVNITSFTFTVPEGGS